MSARSRVIQSGQASALRQGPEHAPMGHVVCGQHLEEQLGRVLDDAQVLLGAVSRSTSSATSWCTRHTSSRLTPAAKARRPSS